jgi:hypothetical protein
VATDTAVAAATRVATDPIASINQSRPSEEEAAPAGVIRKPRVNTVTLSNLDPRLDTDGKIVDCHSGNIVHHQGKYFLYGERYAPLFAPWFCTMDSAVLAWTMDSAVLAWTIDSAVFHELWSLP